MLWVLALGPHFENHCSINNPEDSGWCLSAFVWGRNDFLKIGVPGVWAVRLLNGDS